VNRDVLISGAGVGGAALALALAHRCDLRVLVVEKRPGPGYINRGDSLLPAVTRHLDAWGALERCRAAGARAIRKMQVFDHRNGFLLEAPLGGGKHPYLVLPHPEIERALADTARCTGRVEIRYLSKIVRLLEGDGRVRGAVVADSEGNEEAVNARLVVGADGATSTVRHLLGIPLLKVAYDHGYFIIDFERPPAYEDAMRLELHPDGGVMIMPQIGAWVGLAVLVGPPQQDLFRAGVMERKVEAIWRRAPILRGMQPRLKGSHLYQLSRAHAPSYLARGAALIGDAVHVTNPTAGQGMTMAIEDGACLAREVGPVLAARADDAAIDRALFAYQRERRAANASLVRWSHWMGRFFSLGGNVGDEVRRRVFAFGMTPMGKLIHKTVWNRVGTRKAS